MPTPISELSVLLQSLNPSLNDGVFAFASVPHGFELADINPIATFREVEGLTIIAEEKQLIEAGIPILFRAAWITLSVNSDLNAVGLTAAISSALSNTGIACNVVAGAYHDHIFVPVATAQRAIATLRSLQTTPGRFEEIPMAGVREGSQ